MAIIKKLSAYTVKNAGSFYVSYIKKKNAGFDRDNYNSQCSSS